MSFQPPDFLEAQRKRVNTRLVSSLSGLEGNPTADDASLLRLKSASLEALTNGGKRIRALLVYNAYHAVQPTTRIEGLDDVACAIEMIHTYSLIHDDLPAMDNDDLRRGKPSCHKAYDEATAILAGDGLQAKAFELLAEAKGFSATQRLTMIQVLSKAAGFDGMVGGQAIDIAAAQSSLTLQQLKTMHSLKTGALIKAALAMGAIAAEAETAQRTALELFGAQIGLAFQIVDDILDVEGNTATLGKTGGKDSEANKPTYVQLLGLIDAKSEARKLFSLALKSLQDFDGSADPLRQLASYVIERDR